MTRKMAVSSAGALLGVLALIGGALHYFLGPITGPTSLEEAAYEVARDVRDAVIAGIRGEERDFSEEQELDPDDLVRIGVLSAGGLAIALGILGMIRREVLPLGVASVYLGMTAMVLQVSIVIAGILAALLLLLAVLHVLGVELPGDFDL